MLHHIATGYSLWSPLSERLFIHGMCKYFEFFGTTLFKYLLTEGVDGKKLVTYQTPTLILVSGSSLMLCNPSSFIIPLNDSLQCDRDELISK